MRDIVQAAPSTWPLIEDINNHILTGEMYKALKETKKLIAYEEELLAQCKTRPKHTEKWQSRPQVRVIWKQICCCKAAARLQAVSDGWDNGREQLDEALLYNRKLWSIFLTSVTRQDNPLPAAVRQNVANLGVFVMNQTLSLMTEPQARAARRADQHQSRARGRPDRPLNAQTRATFALAAEHSLQRYCTMLIW